MNWVGGSRNRVVMKNDARKQREFFERRRMQQKLKNLGIALPESPGATGSGSMDLVTLFIVNQIAAKKENKGPPKVTVVGSGKRRSSGLSTPLVLPMSPCSPSQLSLVESQPRYSDQGTRKRGRVIPQGFKCRQHKLSPVLESAFSDNSAPDYLPPMAGPLSPFSSTSSASSGQGMFPQNLNLQQRGRKQTQLPPHCSPAPWDTSGLEQIKFQPFSQPRGMTNYMPWSRGSNPPRYQLETPTAAHVLFGSPEPGKTKVRDPARREVSFSLNQPEDKGPTLDFMLNQSDTEQQSEVDVFRGFSSEECEREAFGSAKSKIYLRDGTPVKSSTPQTVPDSQCLGMELSNCSDIDFSCPRHNAGPMNGCGYSPSYSGGGSYLSSDSNDEEEYCRPCLQASASSYMEQACCAVTPNQGSQGKRKQRHSPLRKPSMNFRVDQKATENVPRPDKTSGSNGQQSGSSTETRDAGTQTVDIPAAETCDASTQCGFAADRAPDASVCLPPADASVQHPATGRQTHTAAEPHTHTASSGSRGSGGEHTPWSGKKSKAGSLSDRSIINAFTANNGDGKVSLHRPTNHFLDALSVSHDRGEEGRDERAQQEDVPLTKDLSGGVREEDASAARVNGPSEEVEALQEIADILLLLKQRKKEG